MNGFSKLDTFQEISIDKLDAKMKILYKYSLFNNCMVVMLSLLSLSNSLMAQENGYDRWELINNGKLIVSSKEDTQGNKDLSFPSIVKVPSWVSTRADTNANYYLYYAEHHGDYLRMKWAENIEGPWHEYNTPGTGGYGTALRGIMDFEADSYRGATPKTEYIEAEKEYSGWYDNHTKWREDWFNGGHIAAPDVWIDDENHVFTMVFHGKTGLTHLEETFDDGTTRAKFFHQEFVAFSKDGLNFNDPETGGGQQGTWSWKGQYDIPFGPLETVGYLSGLKIEVTQNICDGYARLFKLNGNFYTLTTGGSIYRPRDPENPWKVPQFLVVNKKKFDQWWEPQNTPDDLWKSNDPFIENNKNGDDYDSHITTWFLSSEFANHPNNPYPGYAIFGGSSSPKVNHPEVNVLSDDRIEVFIYIRGDTDDWYPVDDPWRQITRIELDVSDKDWNNWHLASHSQTGLPVFDVVITPADFKAAVEQANGGDIDGTVFADPVSMGVPGYYEENGEKYLFCGFKSYDVNPDFEHSEGQIAPIRIYSNDDDQTATPTATLNQELRIFPNP
ncbi:hypothetical protein ACFLR8_04775, partial [Bacteroidota bacterium]